MYFHLLSLTIATQAQNFLIRYERQPNWKYRFLSSNSYWGNITHFYSYTILIVRKQHLKHVKFVGGNDISLLLRWWNFVSHVRWCKPATHRHISYWKNSTQITMAAAPAYDLHPPWLGFEVRSIRGLNLRAEHYFRARPFFQIFLEKGHTSGSTGTMPNWKNHNAKL